MVESTDKNSFSTAIVQAHVSEGRLRSLKTNNPFPSFQSCLENSSQSKGSNLPKLIFKAMKA